MKQTSRKLKTLQKNQNVFCPGVETKAEGMARLMARSVMRGDWGCERWQNRSKR